MGYEPNKTYLKNLYTGNRIKYIYHPTEINREDASYPLLEKIMNHFGWHYLISSILISENAGVYEDEEENIRNFLKSKKVKNIIEIGTFRGVSALLFSDYAEQVKTIDIHTHTQPLPLWVYFGKIRSIDYITVKDDQDKKEVSDNSVFDFAFIDGEHSTESVKYDFECVKKCGRVLFHDYYNRKIIHHYGVKEFVDTLPKEEVTIFEPFAYWEKNGIQ